MHQLGIPFQPSYPSRDAILHAGRRQYVLRRAAEAVEHFKADFYAWLKANIHVYERFELEANRVWEAGRRHYSARTIGEVLRHESALTASDDGEWKLNDHRWPDLARLWLVVYPDRKGFFELRGRAAA